MALLAVTVAFHTQLVVRESWSLGSVLQLWRITLLHLTAGSPRSFLLSTHLALLVLHAVKAWFLLHKS
jgi:hypothetical protein